jgi:glycosyltransferase involved in cell wall biosynthesis
MSTISTANRLIQKKSLRIAWLGPTGEGGGVPGMGAMLLDEVLRQEEITVDYYCSFEEVPDWLRQHRNLTIVSTPRNWSWNRWYSNTPFKAFLSATLARTRAHNRLCDLLLAQHASNPYDCIFQLSQTELFKLGKNRHRLPPIVIYPCVHAAGELYWHRHESAYALQSEPAWMHYLVRAFLTYRTAIQKREMQKPALVIGMSQRFNQLIAKDYGISLDRQAVLYHPILPQDEITRCTADEAAQSRTIFKVLFVARISVRKGVQYIIELSHRLNDLAGQVQIDVIGGHTQWSDYRGHLKELNPQIAHYLGSMKHKDILESFNQADILLLPSLYEPGGIVVGEALSCGLCVVSSDAVGSAEILDSECHREFPAEDLNEFERQVRQLIEDLKTRRQELRQCAREQAQKHFAPDKISQDITILFESVVSDYDKECYNNVIKEQPII